MGCVCPSIRAELVAATHVQWNEHISLSYAFLPHTTRKREKDKSQRFVLYKISSFFIFMHLGKGNPPILGEFKKAFILTALSSSSLRVERKEGGVGFLFACLHIN